MNLVDKDFIILDDSNLVVQVSAENGDKDIFAGDIKDAILQDQKDIKGNKQILKRIGYVLELLVYPCLIESNTVRNLLEIIGNKKVEKLSDFNTRDVLQIARILKEGELPSNEIKSLLKDCKDLKKV